ncbi:Ger(x)C family spore germination protein [Fictibacillus gelatini]|uniref:Ger(x)C family spore germination protein n=1 Tax=Fictibacillus gelatini TaxID=225985 RepID=UPI0024803EC0|nr:Ger(x)C family spore germination protein [Fictibacillus gelatini]
MTPKNQEQAMPKNVTFTAESFTSQNVLHVLQSESPRPLAVGRVGVALFSEKLAKRGILQFIDGLQRNADIGRDIPLAVVKGEAKEMLELQTPVNQIPAKYILDLIEQNQKENIPNSDLHSFLYHLYGKGLDPFMPLLELKDGLIKIKGIALFSNGKYVDDINYEEAFIFKLLFENFKKGSFEARIGKNKYINIENISSKVNYHVINGNTNPKVTITVKLMGLINESEGISLNVKKKESVEERTRKLINGKAKKLLRRFQHERIDPLGIADQARSQTRNFNFAAWEKRYPTIPIDFKLDINLVEAGIVEEKK